MARISKFAALLSALSLLAALSYGQCPMCGGWWGGGWMWPWGFLGWIFGLFLMLLFIALLVLLVLWLWRQIARSQTHH
ncbi:hypothetical protein [Thermoproteus uzoniensis]|uniref:hypothetical protein n=1 Tax=Thermoproteus uzoniensis TaxID=184117 RepID=UPI0011E51FE4|nr:hypothetical protein [Thermoproteus uzoniensis]